MARRWKIALAILGTSVLATLLSFPALLRNVLPLQNAVVTEEQARREIAQPALETSTDTPETVQLFWASANQPAVLVPSEVELALAADPVRRAKQLITALITRAPSPEQRTLPAGTILLQFYLLPDGTAVADFSEALANAQPSGILSEQMTVDSLTRTLAANNPSGVHRLKILIHGQEVETLAGHLDLTGFFPVGEPPPVEAQAPSAAASMTP
jgi:hypothetical protein